jgi:Ca2+-dependent lipid-binding protein
MSTSKTQEQFSKKPFNPILTVNGSSPIKKQVLNPNLSIINIEKIDKKKNITNNDNIEKKDDLMNNVNSKQEENLKENDEYLNISPKYDDHDIDGGELKKVNSSTSSYSHNNEFLIPDDYTLSFPWRKIGSFIDENSDLSKHDLEDLSLNDESNKLTTYIFEKYYADLYWNCSLVLGCTASAWCFSYLNYGFFSFIFVSICTFATYRSEFRRFNINIRDDMQRIQSRENLEKRVESMDWLNSFLAKFWIIYMPALSDLVITNTNLTLSTVEPPPPIDKLTLAEFTLGTKAPKIESIRSFTKLGKDLYQMDWNLNFTPNDINDMTQNELKNKIDPKISLGIRIGKGFVGASLPVLVENMSFIGNLRIKIKLGDVYPHIDLVSVCFMEPPKIDYALKPVGGNTLGIDVMSVIPGLSSFVNSLINSNLAPLMYYPNTIDVKPSDFLQHESAIGCLLVKIRGAEFISKELINPYIKFGAENDLSKTYQTDIKSKTVTPIFNECQRILINNLNSKLKFELFNLLRNGDSLSIGEAYFELQDLLQDPVLALNESKFIKNNKNVGKLIYDLRWYPVLKPEILPDGSKSNPPDSEIGIINVNIVSALNLDTSKSLLGKLSTFIEIYVDNKLVQTSRIVKGSNNPEFNFQFETLIYNKSISMLKILVKDISSFKETTVGEYKNKILDLTLMGSDDINEKKNQIIKPFTEGQGGLKFTSTWKPLDMLSEDDNDDNVSFVPPIGIFKIGINSCSNLHKVDTLASTDPYIKILSGGLVRGITSVIEDTHNPEFDEEFFVPILSKDQKIRFNCYNKEQKSKTDKLIGDLILNLSSIFHESENQNISIDFEKKLTKNGKQTGSISFSLTYYPLLPILSYHELEQIRIKSEKNHDKEEDMEELEEQAKYLEDYKKHPDDYEWVDIDEEEGLKDLIDVNKDRVTLSFDDLMKSNSGVLGINLTSGHLNEKSAYLQIFIDDHDYPDFISRKSKSGIITSASGECFIRDLRHSILNFRIVKTENVISKDDILYQTIDSFNVYDLLKSGFEKPVNVELDGNSLNFIFEFVPLLKDSGNIFESVEDTGLLKLDVISATGLKSSDANGYSDPFVVGYLNKRKVFKTKVVKKTLHPEFNESFTIPVKSKNRQKLRLELWDWDRVGDNDPLGNVLININEIPKSQEITQAFKLDTQGSIKLKLQFTAGYLKPNTSMLLSTEENMFDLTSTLTNGLALPAGAIGYAGDLATDAIGRAGGLATGALGRTGGLASGAVGNVTNTATGFANGLTGGLGRLLNRDEDNGDNTTVKSNSTNNNNHSGIGLKKLKPSFIGHRNKHSDNDLSSLRSRDSVNFSNPADLNNHDVSSQQLRIPSSPGIINNGNYNDGSKGRSSMDVVSVVTNSFSGSNAITGRLSILEFESTDNDKINDQINILVSIISSNGTEKKLYKTRKYKIDYKNGNDIKWHENVAFKCDSNTKMVFKLRSHKTFGKTEELGNCGIKLDEVVGVKDDIKLSVKGKINGTLTINFNYA